MAETRAFKVNPAIIRHLISSQAGTLEKAFSECVMNSLDAGATKVEITLTNAGFSVVDDGCGFKTREEVLACFEVFGFEHNDKDRVFGQFGLGRAQLWNWATTVWRTHQFVLDVDIRNHGLDYELAEKDENQAGMTIDGGFYDRLPETERQSCIRGLERLCKYSVIPVIVNGRNVQQDPATANWQYEDENCWIRKTDTWNADVYNQGILVRGYSSSEMGIGGAIVTKRGKVLAVNMSRTDVLTQTCKLWPKIKAAAAKLMDVEVKTGKSRLTDEKRDFLARATIDSDDDEWITHLRVFTLANGRHETLATIATRLYDNHKAVFTTAPRGDKLAERAIRDNFAVVLDPRTLARFDADGMSGLFETLLTRMRAVAPRSYYLHALEAARPRVFESLSASPVESMLRTELVPKHQWKPAHKNVIAAMEGVNSAVSVAVAHHTGVHNPRRELTVGESNAAEAFTDGSTFVAIETEVLDKIAHDGLPGFMRLTGLLVHEYLHNDDDSGSHVHDPEFYEAFHEIMLDTPDLYDAAVSAFRYYAHRAARLNGRLAKQVDATAVPVAA